VLEKIPKQLEASFLIFLTLGLIKQSNTHNQRVQRCFSLFNTEEGVLLCFIDPRVRKIRNEAPSCPGLFSKALRYVASFPGSPLPHLLDGHRKLVGSSAIPARSCPGPVGYPWGSIVELEVPPNETPGLMT